MSVFGAVLRIPTRWLATGLAVLGAAALLGTGPTGTAQAAYPGNDGLLAFVRGGNIFTVNTAHPASSQVQLTTDGRASGPRWAPSGQRIAYLDGGNLWVMNRDGSHKVRITDGAPGYTDSRPSWSPNGDYIAFVKTKRGHVYGYLTRYSFLTRSFRSFTTTVNGHLIKVAALPAPVAWAWARSSSNSYGSYIAYEGAAGPLCPYAHRYCLNLLGFASESDYQNGFPSAEDTRTTFRLTDPDWYPNSPLYDSSLMTTQENCAASHCTPVGLDISVGAAPRIHGAYQGVFSPSGGYIAYVRNVAGHPEIYQVLNNEDLSDPVQLVAGSQPDWQPLSVLS
jgi:hypothetical protein